jgi:hypothetical protein
MRDDELLTELLAFKRQLDYLANGLKHRIVLAKNGKESPTELRKLLKKMHASWYSLNLLKEAFPDVGGWLGGFEKEIIVIEESFRQSFGTQLEAELKKKGLRLSGHYPTLKVSLFTIEPDFTRAKANLWFGPRQEIIGRCPLDVSSLSKYISEIKLGCGIDAGEFRETLFEAYNKTPYAKENRPSPIIEVLKELANLVQSLRHTSKPLHPGYGRADFGFDLYRVNQLPEKDDSDRRFHLVVATLGKTQHRKNFLWVPSTEDGAGAVYSYLKF